MITYEKTVPSRLWDVVRALEGVPPVGAPGSETHLLVTALTRHRLLPIAARDPGFSHEEAAAITRACDEAQEAVREQRRAQDDTLRRALDLLPLHAVIVLKGADFAEALYGRAEWRPMDDVDMLVRPGSTNACVASLEAAGWPICRLGQNEFKFQDPANAVYLDLYTALIQQERVAVNYDTVWQQADVGWHGGLSLSPVHALVTVALDLANQQFQTHLRKLLDLWRLTRPSGVMEAAIDTSRTWRMRRALFSSMRQLEFIAPEIRDEAWFPQLHTLVSERERQWLSTRVLPQTAVVSQVSGPTRLRRKFALIDGRDQRLRFVLAHLRQRL